MKRKNFVLISLSLAINSSLIAAPSKNGTYTDPSKVDSDYAIQGEYEGKVEGGKAGAQVIALGDGKFDVVGYPGGLPGAGWNGDKDNRVRGKGQISDGKTSFEMENGLKVSLVDAGSGKVMHVTSDGEKVGTLERVVRKSPTLGMRPPEGAVILFDGKDHGADLWKGGRVSEDGFLMEGCTSKETFGDFKIHFEFRTPYKPKARGQGRGNSGFYAHGRYEVQVLDSFGLEGE